MWPKSITTHSRPRPSSLLSPASLTALLLFLPSCITAFDCGDILAQGVKFNLKSLAGPRKVHWLDKEYEHEERLSNYTFTIDICQALLWDKGTGKETNCEHGTQVCGIREDIDKSGSHGNTITPISIAGTYGRGREIDERFELFKNSKSNADSDREGFRAELHGGKFGDHKQRAIIEFVCDRNRTGLEGEEKDKGEKDGDQKDDGDKDKDKDKNEGKDEGKDGGKDGRSKQLWSRDADDGCENNDNSLRFCKYERGNEIQTLRLQWRTKEACEDSAAPGSDSKGWGFFTWFIIIVFLATAAYLIFGSWLNYNRYGARGWDLLPHGDTIRDVPYILKDWGRRVTSTLQGSGSRGGYSAV